MIPGLRQFVQRADDSQCRRLVRPPTCSLPLEFEHRYETDVFWMALPWNVNPSVGPKVLSTSVSEWSDPSTWTAGAWYSPLVIVFVSGTVPPRYQSLLCGIVGFRPEAYN